MSDKKDTLAPSTIQNLPTLAQRLLGIQQAQTVLPENVAADAIARLTESRGDLRRLEKLWSSVDEAGPDLVAAWNPDEHREAVLALRAMIDRGFVTTRERSGRARALRPLSPRLITRQRPNTVFRAAGLSVVDGLLAGADQDMRGRLTERVRSWERRHPLASVLAPLCEPAKLTSAERVPSVLAEMFRTNDELEAWRTKVVLRDWQLWLEATESLSADEQLDSFATLAGLHLHLALTRRLASLTAGGPIPALFAAVGGGTAHHACRRAATGFLAFWRERVGNALRTVAEGEVDRLAAEDSVLRDALQGDAWTKVALWSSSAVKFDKSMRSARQRFEQHLEEALALAKPKGAPAPGQARNLVIDALTETFSGSSSAADKLKSYHRVTGMAGGIVGPTDRGSFKRYLLDDRALELLARLHVHRRPEDVSTTEDEPSTVEAFLDDVFARYGVIVTTERPKVRQSLEKLQNLQRLLPDPDSVRHNREQFERRLEALRLLRRFSDASAVLHVTE